LADIPILAKTHFDLDLVARKHRGDERVFVADPSTDGMPVAVVLGPTIVTVATIWIYFGLISLFEDVYLLPLVL
jgi:hypothetical protein